MRILYAGKKFDEIMTGGARRVCNVLNYLSDNGITVEYLHNVEEPTPRELRSFILMNLWYLKRIFRERHSAQTILLVDYPTRHYIFIANIAARLITGLRVVTLVNAFSFSYRTSKVKNYLDRQVSKIFFKTAHLVIAGRSSAVVELKSLGVPSEKTCVINQAVRPEFSAALNEDIPFKANNNPLRILTVGRFHPIKGLEYLVEAFGMLDNGSAELVIVGDNTRVPWYTEKVLATARRAGVEGSVKLLGDIKDVEELIEEYRKADIFVLPSLWELLGIVLIEAMCLGLPVVASNVGGIPEIVSDGECGYLVPPGNSRAIARALSRLIVDKTIRQTFSERAKQGAATFVSRTWDDVGKDYHRAMCKALFIAGD